MANKITPLPPQKFSGSAHDSNTQHVAWSIKQGTVYLVKGHGTSQHLILSVIRTNCYCTPISNLVLLATAEFQMMENPEFSACY